MLVWKPDDFTVQLGRALVDVEAKADVRRLESIIHPRVRARTAELIASAPPDAIVVNDVPLLVEAGLAATYHLVIVVQADTEAADQLVAALLSTF